MCMCVRVSIDRPRSSLLPLSSVARGAIAGGGEAPPSPAGSGAADPRYTASPAAKTRRGIPPSSCRSLLLCSAPATMFRIAGAHRSSDVHCNSCKQYTGVRIAKRDINFRFKRVVLNHDSKKLPRISYLTVLLSQPEQTRALAMHYFTSGGQPSSFPRSPLTWWWWYLLPKAHMVSIFLFRWSDGRMTRHNAMHTREEDGGRHTHTFPPPPPILLRGSTTDEWTPKPGGGGE